MLATLTTEYAQACMACRSWYSDTSPVPVQDPATGDWYHPTRSGHRSLCQASALRNQHAVKETSMNDLLPQTNQTVMVQLTLFDLEQLEVKVRDGLAKFMEVGNALAEIRDREGYKLKGYKDFESYVEKEFGFSLRQGQRLIAAAATAAKVKQFTGGETVRNEAAARVLAPVADDEKTVKKVDAQLKAKGLSIGTATAEKIQEVVEKVTGKAKPTTNGSGNGHKPESKPEPKVERQPEPVKAAPKLDSAHVNGLCPYCHSQPNTFISSRGGYVCGDCNHPVWLTVIESAKPEVYKTCRRCGTKASADDIICNKCGGVLK